ncbi:STAS domain-containing protein [Actinosynnema sp. NPDC023658]|uniref:STAS domain-containing protein n=1 Tax=Actinosynnema sp. NPDC023658 TaxID=3155465 RepID=UPI0033E6B3A4
MKDFTDAVTLTAHEDTVGVVVVEVAGELDTATTTSAEDFVLRRLGSGVRTLVLDLSGVTFLGSTGINMLITVRAACARTGTALRLVANTKVVLRPLQLTDLVDQFDIVTAVSEAS